ncbi:MAG: hypothetical protein WCI62_01960 [Erysipelotrichaceae bacterium]
MRRWHAYIEYLHFPLQVLYIATFILGLSGLLLNANFQLLIVNSPDYIKVGAEILKYLAAFIILYYPLIFLMRAVIHKNDDPMLMVGAFIGYITFHIGTMFFATKTLDARLFRSVLGLTIDTSNIQVPMIGVLTPLHTGLIGALIVLVISRLTVKMLARRSPYTFFSFIDKNVSIVLWLSFFSLLGGIVFAYIWPVLMTWLMMGLRFIASDLTNPVNIFLYGVVDRLMNVLNFSHVSRQLFWFGDLGGSWSNAFGTLSFGDVNIWTAQQAYSIYGLGSGKLITPYYILNIFAIPGFLLAAFKTFTDKIEKKRIRIFLIIALFSSILFGTLLPIELFLLITAPLLFGFHVFYTGILFASMLSMNVIIGYSYTGDVMGANPGSIVDLLIHMRNPIYQKPLLIILLVGILSFLLYYAVSTLYYQRGAVNLISSAEEDNMIDELLDCMGGIANIKLINASVNKLSIQVHDRSLVDFHKIHHHYISKIVETRAGYALSYGSASFMLYTAIQQRLETQVQASA